MDFFALLVIFAVIWAIGHAIKSPAPEAVHAGARRSLATPQLGPLEARLIDGRLSDDPDSPQVKKVEVRGWFLLRVPATVGFVTSVLDTTSTEAAPVLSAIEGLQEPHTAAYQSRAAIGPVEPAQGFTEWIRVGFVAPEIIQPPRGGRRKLLVVLRLVDLDDEPDITCGFCDSSQDGLLWQTPLTFTWSFEEKGYEEAAEHRDEALGLTIQIAMSVAMADGNLDDAEGHALKEWITKRVAAYPDSRKPAMRDACNRAMREAHAAAESGLSSLSGLTQRLAEIGDKSTRYGAVELCFDIMAADGVAQPSELKVIRGVAEALDLEMTEINKLRDQKIVRLDSTASTHASVEDLLGIQPSWDAASVKKHLRTEFQKWNDRLNTLSDAAEKANAQRMLDVIAEARKKYA